jgi:hypothetical protein
MGLDSCIVVEESHFELLKVMSSLIVLKLNLLFLHQWVYLCFARKFSASYPAKLTTAIAIVVGTWTSSQTLGIIDNKEGLPPPPPLFLLYHCLCRCVTITFVGRGGRRGWVRLGIPWHHCHVNSNSLEPPKLK